MRTARLLTVSQHALYRGRGVYPSMHWAEGGVCLGVSAQGGVCPEMSAQGLSAQGVSAQGVSVCGVYPGGVYPELSAKGGMSAQGCLSDTPCEQNDRQV